MKVRLVADFDNVPDDMDPKNLEWFERDMRVTLRLAGRAVLRTNDVEIIGVRQIDAAQRDQGA